MQSNWNLEDFDKLIHNNDLKKIAASAIKVYGNKLNLSKDEYQQCFYISLFDSLRKYNGKIKFTTFLYNNVKFYLLNYRKEYSAMRPTHQSVVMYEDFQEPIDESLDIETYINGLSEEEQTIVRMYYFDDYSMREAAEILGMHRLMFMKKLKSVLRKSRRSGVFSNR